MRRFAPALLALALYCVIAGLIFAPVLGQFTTHCLSHPQGEISMKLWDQARTADGIRKTGGLPDETMLVNFPYGGKLFTSDPLNCLLFHSVFTRFGAAARYNIAPMAHLVLNAMAAFFVALYLTGSPGGALFAGAAFGFSPYLLSYGIESGSSEATCAAGFPLLLLFAIRTVREPNLSNPILAAASLFFLVVASNYYGVFGLLLLFVLCVYLALFARRAEDLSLRDDVAPSDAPLWNRGVLARIALCVVATIAMTVPYGLAVYRTVATPRAVLPRVQLENRRADVTHFFPDENGQTRVGVLVDLVLPGKDAARVMEAESRFVRVTYCGMVLLTLAALSLRRRRRFLMFLGCAALFFVLLFVGPYMQISSSLNAGAPVNGVFVAFFYGFPMFGMIFEPFRLHVLITLFLSLMAAAALRDLSPGRFAVAIGFAAAVLVTAEYLLVSPLPFPLSVTALDEPLYSRALKSDTRPYAIIELPLRVRQGGLFYKRIFYAQTVHQRSIPNCVAFTPPLMNDSALYRALLVLAADIQPKEGDRELTDAEVDAGFIELEKMGFGRIMLHTDVLTPQGQMRLGGFLRRHLGRPVNLGEGVEAYDLPSYRTPAP